MTVPHSVKKSPRANNAHHDGGGRSIGNGSVCVLPGVRDRDSESHNVMSAITQKFCSHIVGYTETINY